MQREDLQNHILIQNRISVIKEGKKHHTSFPLRLFHFILISTLEEWQQPHILGVKFKVQRWSESCLSHLKTYILALYVMFFPQRTQHTYKHLKVFSQRCQFQTSIWECKAIFIQNNKIKVSGGTYHKFQIQFSPISSLTTVSKS